ncbi:UPF0755 protein [Sporobacter termitidis DSM 10068]|uniref:Endolytic murein transglycosylase n=1 Tax=Sporobacter termitidis DSM 10068 TaxID=1123282 RepID=A0A1M5YM81_9FIRM|nr:endolytic transglycosylase MltG [Sporobacter termitidis]SHI13195.1 UPF0755 protein [Sporobacter termitidis DSM 10068]
MTENSDYWKELLGDDYNDELMNILQGSSQPENPDEPPAAAGQRNDGVPEDADDSSRFYNYDLIPPEVPASKNTGKAGGPPARDRRKSDKDDDFDVTFDFDGEYRDVPDNRPLRQRREKRTGCLGGVLYAVFIICVCLLLASLLWLAATDVLGLGNEDVQVQVTVPQDYTVAGVTDTLYQDGLIKYKFLFKLYADFSHASEKLTPGTYVLNKNYDYRALVNGMSARGGKRVEVTVTIPEGNTVKQIIELLTVNNVCKEDELWDTVTNYDFNYDFLDKSTLGDKHRLEGFLFPDTYTFYVGNSPTGAIDKMLSNFKSKFKAEYLTKAKDMGYSVRDILTVASMIEKEAGNDEERATIASVIYNRLNNSKSFPYLQIDATIIYAIADTQEAFSTDVDSPYNTYKVKGLPAGPIANPGIASIKAALYPASTKYYYYALNKDRAHNFFKDRASFEAFIKSDKYGG